MKKTLLFVLITVFSLISLSVYAAPIDVTNVDKVVIKYKLNDDSVKEIEQINRNNGKVETAIINLLDYLSNIQNIKEIVSINDIDIKDTQYSKYATPIEIKGLGYSNSKDIIAINSFNQSVRISTDTPEVSSTNIQDIKNGDIKDVQPYYVKDILYLPLSAILTNIGYTIEKDYNNYYQYLIATQGSSKIEIKTLESFVLVDTKKVSLSTPCLYNSSYSDIYVTPSDAIKITGYGITFNTKSNIIHIEKSDGGEISK